MKILVIEGMGSFPCVRSGLIAPLLAQYKLDVLYAHWNVAPGLSVDKYDLVIGHSLGGHSALKVAARDPRPTYLTLDPRRQDALSWTDWLIPWRGAFPSPGNGARIVNFYQKLPLSGYAVEGAENRLVVSTHGGLPGNRHVVAWVRKFIEDRL